MLVRQTEITEAFLGVTKALGTTHYLYALSDDKAQSFGANLVTYDKARSLNLGSKTGIFTNVNLFPGGLRRKHLIQEVQYWIVDIDNKEDWIVEKILSAPLPPNFIVETRNGFHLWFRAESGNPETYSSVIEDHLLAYYPGDHNAKDLSRIMRVPGFYHHKSDPFPVGIEVISDLNAYREEEIINAYPSSQEVRAEKEAREAKIVKKLQRNMRVEYGDDLFEKIYNLDCYVALSKLSGSKYVFGETYTFKRNSNGNKNIYVNERGTSTFLDRSNRIGSLSRGGPTIIQWLTWMGHSKRAALAIVKEYLL